MLSSELPEIEVVFKQEELSVGVYNEDEKSNFASAIFLTGTVANNLFDGLWHQGAGMSQRPQSADPIRSQLSSDISTFPCNIYILYLQKGDIIDALERQATRQQVLDFGPQNAK